MGPDRRSVPVPERDSQGDAVPIYASITRVKLRGGQRCIYIMSPSRARTLDRTASPLSCVEAQPPALNATDATVKRLANVSRKS